MEMILVVSLGGGVVRVSCVYRSGMLSTILQGTEKPLRMIVANVSTVLRQNTLICSGYCNTVSQTSL